MIPRSKSIIRISELVLLALAVALTLFAVMALARWVGDDVEIDHLLQRYAASQSGDTPAESDTDAKNHPNKNGSPLDALVKGISKRHLFSLSPGAPKQKTFSLVGTLGDKAFFSGNEQGFKIGQSYKGAKIKEIGPDWVEIEVEGKLQKLHVFGPPGSGSQPSGPVRSAKSMPPGFKLTPEMIEKAKSMPPEMRQKALKRMPAELREQLKKAL